MRWVENSRTEGSSVIGDRGHTVVSYMPDIVGMESCIFGNSQLKGLQMYGIVLKCMYYNGSDKEMFFFILACLFPALC